MASVSIQLPDLPNLTRAFELRANKACRSITLASEARFLKPNPTLEPNNNFILSNTECTILPSVKIGLLSSLCFPTCDPPQLRFLTDFMTLLTFAHERLIRARNPAESGWSPRVVGDAGESDESDEFRPKETVVRSGIEVLNEHELFKSLTPELTNFCSRASPGWYARFSRSSLTYQHAQLDSLKPPSTPFLGNDDPSILESYVSLRRDISGAHMIFDLVEVALGYKPLEDIDNNMDLDNQHRSNLAAAQTILIHALDTLRDLAAEIVALSSDIASYSQFQSARHTHPPPDHLPHNAIMVCMLSRNLSSQGAINIVVNLLKHKIQSFLDLESSLQSLSDSRTPGDNPSCAWITSPIKSMITTTTRALTSIADKEKPKPKTPLIKSLSALRPLNAGLLSNLVGGSLDSYIHILRNYISGNVHWFYETELYFGTKGEEVKAFGWVFLNSPQVASGGP